MVVMMLSDFAKSLLIFSYKQDVSFYMVGLFSLVWRVTEWLGDGGLVRAVLAVFGWKPGSPEENHPHCLGVRVELDRMGMRGVGGALTEWVGDFTGRYRTT